MKFVNIYSLYDVDCIITKGGDVGILSDLIWLIKSPIHNVMPSMIIRSELTSTFWHY